MRIVKQINFHASFLPWFQPSIFYHSSRRKRSHGSLGHCSHHHLRINVCVCACLCTHAGEHVCVCPRVCEGQGNRGVVTGGEADHLLRIGSLQLSQGDVRTAGHSSTTTKATWGCLRAREWSGAERTLGALSSGLPRVKREKDLHQHQQEFHLPSPTLTV